MLRCKSSLLLRLQNLYRQLLFLPTLSKRPCLTDYISEDLTSWNNHVHLGLWADAMVIYPATMNTIAKISNGICDNLLLATYYSTRCPIFIAPAMDEDMWRHPSNALNINKLKNWQQHYVWSVQLGELASGTHRRGTSIRTR